jgi:hypothetical protein
MLENKTGTAAKQGQKKLPPFRVVLEAFTLEEYSLRLTSSDKRFPKKFRFSLCYKIQATAIEISCDLTEANEIDSRDKGKRQLRKDFQNSAMRKCKVLLHLIELSKKMKFIDDNSFEHWSKLANNVKNMCAKWHESDIDRAAQFDARKGGIL